MAVADLSWVDALKYGPAGLAGIATVWTAGLLQRELSRQDVRPAAQGLITRFMIFTGLLMIVSGAFAYLDTSKEQEMVQKLNRISAIASGLDASLLAKAAGEPGLSGNKELKEVLADAIHSMCQDVERIGAITGATDLGTKCKQSIPRVLPQ